MTAASAPRAYALWWKDLPRWDIKTARATRFRLLHPTFRPLGDFVEEATELVRPWERPEHEWPVYGVNNVGGVFFSHNQRGDTFNAPYKRIRPDWFFHNPTRANVGSLGRVPDVSEDALTSPEYQVWRIRYGLRPEYASILIQCPFFVELIECHRVGAVKERLFVENLCEIPIPVRTDDEQTVVISAWKSAQADLAATRAKIAALEDRIGADLLSELGFAVQTSLPRPKYYSLMWSELNRWGVELAWREHNQSHTCKYTTRPLADICETGTGGTPSRRRSEYFGGGIPWVKTTEVRNNVIVSTEETLTTQGLAHCQGKLYPLGSIIMAMYGQGATRGRTAKLGVEAATNQACLVMTHFTESVLGDFVWHYLAARYDDIRGFGSGNNQPNLSAELVRAFPVPVPPIEQQRRLVEKVEKRRAEIATLRTAAAERERHAKADVEAMILGTKPPEHA